jgi:DHA3 family macrolide efflux protein-like MFS transporter
LEASAGQQTFRDYLSFFLGQHVSLLGSSIAQFVIIWWITLKTQSALYLSLASVLGFAPIVILAPVAGVFVDRWSRKMLIGVVDFLQALTTVALIFLFWLNIVSIWQILVLLALRGCCQAFHGPAVRAIVPLMVPRSKLSRMNGLEYLLSSGVGLMGPVVGAVLLAWLGIDQILWIDPVTFVIALVPLMMARIPPVRIRNSTNQREASFAKEFSEGLTFIRNAKGLLPLIMLATALNFLFTPLSTLLPYYVKFDHSGDAVTLAFVMALSQGGMLAGGLLMLIKKEFKNRIAIFVSFLLISYLGYALMAITPRGSFSFMAIGGLIMSFPIPVVNVLVRTILQVVVPVEIQGRVNSVIMSLASAASPFGMAISGLVVGFTGTANLFLGCACLGAVILVLAWFFTDVRHVDELDHKANEMQKSE